MRVISNQIYEVTFTTEKVKKEKKELASLKNKKKSLTNYNKLLKRVTTLYAFKEYKDR